MKGLEHIPGEIDLIQAYEKLQSKHETISCSEVALWSQWSRFDARLGEQWVAWVAANWKDLSPLLLNSELRRQPWPTAAGPMLEQVPLVKSSLLRDRFFRNWIRLTMTEIPPAEGEQFFIGTRAFGGGLMLEDAMGTLKPYLRWGYLSREILVNKASSSQVKRTLKPAEFRREILVELFRRKHRIQVSDYIEALGGGVSQRQAELDLQKFQGARAIGRTKGRFYQIKGRLPRI